LLITIGLILGIIGGTSTSIEPNGTVKLDGTSKASIVLSIVAYIGIVLVYFISIRHIAIVPEHENRVPVLITFALPLILVRIVYSACGVFLHSHLFSVLNGSVAVRVAMAVVEEFVVVAIYLALGFWSRRVSKDRSRGESGIVKAGEVGSCLGSFLWVDVRNSAPSSHFHRP
jgi:hypothetical protein